MLHIFKEDDRELAIVDVRFITDALIDTISPHIELGVSGTSKVIIKYQDAKQCTLEFLRLTTAMQDEIDSEPELFMVEMD